MWSLDDWKYIERWVVTDPKGRQWSVALMDVLGQEGDPDMPSDMLDLQYASGRYFTLIYSGGGALQWERGSAGRVRLEQLLLSERVGHRFSRFVSLNAI